MPEEIPVPKIKVTKEQRDLVAKALPVLGGMAIGLFLGLRLGQHLGKGFSPGPDISAPGGVVVHPAAPAHYKNAPCAECEQRAAAAHAANLAAEAARTPPVISEADMATILAQVNGEPVISGIAAPPPIVDVPL